MFQHSFIAKCKCKLLQTFTFQLTDAVSENQTENRNTSCSVFTPSVSDNSVTANDSLPSVSTNAQKMPSPALPAPHRSHRTVLNDPFQHATAAFAEAVHALRRKEPCSKDSDSEYPFIAYIKRRMLNVNAEDRQRLEDRILDTIRDFERELSTTSSSFSAEKMNNDTRSVAHPPDAIEVESEYYSSLITEESVVDYD